MNPNPYFPTEEQFEKHPKLRAYLESIEKIQEEFIRENSCEDLSSFQIRMFGVGQLGKPYIDKFESSFRKVVSKKRRRTAYQQHIHNMAVEESLNIKVDKDNKIINKSYNEMKNGQREGYERLLAQTEAYNSLLPLEVEKGAREEVFDSAMKRLKAFNVWLLDEFQVHSLTIYAADSYDSLVEPKCLTNSAATKKFYNFMSEGFKKRRPEQLLHDWIRRLYLVSSGMRDHIAQIAGSDFLASLVAPAPATISASGLPIEVQEVLDAKDSKKKLIKHKDILAAYISKEVYELLQKFYGYEVKTRGGKAYPRCPWATFLGTGSRLKLEPWIRGHNDFVDNRYRPKLLDIEILKENARNLAAKKVKIIKVPPGEGNPAEGISNKN